MARRQTPAIIVSTGSEDESDTDLSSSEGAAELVDDEECWGEGVEPAKEKNT